MMHMVYITASTEKEAQTIGRALLTNRLAACVNVLGKIQSMYWWKEKIQEAPEFALFAKTSEDKVEALITRVKSLHSAKVPCIVSYPISKGNPEFLEWLTSTLER